MLTFLFTEGSAFCSFLFTRWGQIYGRYRSMVHDTGSVKQDGGSTLECARLRSDALRNRMGWPAGGFLLSVCLPVACSGLINANGEQA